MSNIYESVVSGKVVVITGGASGIGREIAHAFVAAGNNVVVGDINAELLTSLQQALGDSCSVLLTDVTDESQQEALVAHAVATYGRLDIGVNCAGGGKPVPLLDLDVATWDQAQALNLKGMFLSIKHQARQMKQQGVGGVIINISSVTASLATVGLSHYASAKAGANHLIRIAADELRQLGIRVVAIAPGIIRTPLTQDVCETPEVCDAYLEHVPCARVGEVEEVARTALFLASDGATYINGSVVYLDGGHSANGGWSDLARIQDHYKT